MDTVKHCEIRLPLSFWEIKYLNLRNTSGLKPFSGFWKQTNLCDKNVFFFYCSLANLMPNWTKIFIILCNFIFWQLPNVSSVQFKSIKITTLLNFVKAAACYFSRFNGQTFCLKSNNAVRTELLFSPTFYFILYRLRWWADRKHWVTEQSKLPQSVRPLSSLQLDYHCWLRPFYRSDHHWLWRGG